ncbi:DNA-binding transcriptional regulator, PadR family [Agreia pratensis]|uniref:DNA-binding transcriptional regulator, PadR family n=2 Tax=Agreia pratensis TaxID=150121 RepID=A0A1X7JH65_9MICO|nr:DNA-binding transcriptional regulator, PadR family [Agreia pratensis]
MEYSILSAVVELSASRTDPYGYTIAASIARADEGRGLTAHGTLYKALGRLVESGMLVAAWEAPETAEGEGRPRRRLYEVTAAGAKALQTHANEKLSASTAFTPVPGRLATS